MLERQKILNEVYEHLHDHWNVHTKGDFADIIGYARAYISSALNGNPKYLTDKLFINIHDAFPDVFNLEYLLHGKGCIITNVEEARIGSFEQDQKKSKPDTIDYTFMIEKAVEKATAYADKTISVLENQLADKDKQLAQRDEYIALLRQRIEQLEAALNAQPDETGKFLFPQGVADKNEEVRARV